MKINEFMARSIDSYDGKTTKTGLSTINSTKNKENNMLVFPMDRKHIRGSSKNLVSKYNISKNNF